MTNDFYCDEVLSGCIEVRRVHETELVLAYHHARPLWPVHVVVIPKQHVSSLTDLGDAPVDLVAELLEVVRDVASGIEKREGAARVSTNLGRCQQTKHLHFHINSGDRLA